MHLPDPQFPPLLEGHAVKAPVQPLTRACRGAEARELGAGDLVWGRNTGRAEIAIVLEPEVALERALQMAPLLMVALEDCLGSLCPPKVAIQHSWPGTLLLNGCTAGAVRIATPRVGLGERPDWLVVAADLDIAAEDERQDWSYTSLHEEAGTEITRTDVLQSLAAHFLTWLNIWSDDGFRPVHDQWLFRAVGRETPLSFAHGGATIDGLVAGLDESANLLLRTPVGKVRSVSFLEHVLFQDEAAARRDGTA
jgi:BirA family transcriptional regulator, biotin operon repressor / biotin---[acetyl-CoA-carboxylase] ligase